MSHSFKFLVEVDLERETGKFASRDDMSEAISSALEDAENGIDVTGLGPDSSSEYTVSVFGITELDNKEERKLWAGYAVAVAAEAPSDAEVRAELKQAKKDLAELKEKNLRLILKNEDIAKEREVDKSRIFSMNYVADRKRYLPEGDRVRFELEDSHSYVDVSIKGDVLELHSSSALIMTPNSSNVLHIRTRSFGEEF